MYIRVPLILLSEIQQIMTIIVIPPKLVNEKKFFNEYTCATHITE
jgi:hypothetical protein